MHKAWSSIKEVSYCFSRSSVKFQGRTGQNIANFDLNWVFQTATPVGIHRWIRNDAQSLKQHRRGALLLFKVICQISRLHGKKYRQFWPELSVSRLQPQLEFIDGLEMMHKAWRNIEEVPYCFFRSSIKFQGHRGWKIDDLNPFWVRLLGRSQLSNPSDLPCLCFCVPKINLNLNQSINQIQFC